MGMSPDAYVFYGFVVHDGFPAEWELVDDLESWEEWEAREELVDVGVGVEYRSMSHDGEAAVMVMVKASLQWAYDWNAIPLSPLNAHILWDGWIRTYCDQMGLDYREPGWHLAADYG